MQICHGTGTQFGGSSQESYDSPKWDFSSLYLCSTFTGNAAFYYHHSRAKLTAANAFSLKTNLLTILLLPLSLVYDLHLHLAFSFLLSSLSLPLGILS